MPIQFQLNTEHFYDDIYYKISAETCLGTVGWNGETGEGKEGKD